MKAFDKLNTVLIKAKKQCFAYFKKPDKQFRTIIAGHGVVNEADLLNELTQREFPCNESQMVSGAMFCFIYV